MSSAHFVQLAREAELRAGSEQRSADLYLKLAQGRTQVRSLVTSLVDAQAMLCGIHRSTRTAMIERSEVIESSSTRGKRWISLASIHALIAPETGVVVPPAAAAVCAADADVIELAKAAAA
jgi:hypothetical protein